MMNIKIKHKYLILSTLALMLCTATNVYADYTTYISNVSVGGYTSVAYRATTSSAPNVNMLYAADYLYRDGVCVGATDEYAYNDNYVETVSSCQNPSGSQFWESYGDHQLTDGTTYTTKSSYASQYN
jgi:hypothetical protein